MRVFLIALLAAISYAQTGHCGDGFFDTTKSCEKFERWCEPRESDDYGCASCDKCNDIDRELCRCAECNPTHCIDQAWERCPLPVCRRLHCGPQTPYVCHMGDDEVLFECSDDPTLWVGMVECMNYCDMRSCPDRADYQIVEDEAQIDHLLAQSDEYDYYDGVGNFAMKETSGTKSDYTLVIIVAVAIFATIALVITLCQYFQKRVSALEECLIKDNYTELNEEPALWGQAGDSSMLAWKDLQLPPHSDSEGSDVPRFFEHRNSVDEFMMNLDPPENPL